MRLRIVPARTGALWVREGLRLFFKQPLAFAGMFFIVIALGRLLAWLPAVGEAIALALMPAFTVGMMAASRAVQAGRFPMPSLLLSAFRGPSANTRAIVVLGALYSAAVLLLMGLASLTNDGKWAEVLAAHGGQLTPETMNDPAVQSAVRASMRELMLTSVLYLPISILFWHAPALVHWHGVPVLKSLFFSAVGVLRNTGAYLVYFMGWTMVTTTAWLALLVVAGMLGNLGVATSGLLPLSLIIAAMAMASLWPTFRDSFDADDAATP